jgi:hypothetical protein
MISADQFNDASIKAMTKSEIEKFNQKNILGCVR